MILLVSAVSVVIAVGIHHEALVLATILTRNSSPRRFRPGAALMFALFAHLLEIGLFAWVWQRLVDAGMATLNIPAPTTLDMFYFSGSLYTSLGFGDIVPIGESRIFAVTEAVIGLVMIAWTASFTYLEMQRNWQRID